MKSRAEIHTRDLVKILCPSEVFLVLLMMTSGVIALCHWDRPDPISLLLPRWVSVTWDATLVVGGLLVLVGLFTLRLLVTRVGYTLIGPAALAYAAALSPYAVTLSIRINVAVLVAFALSCLWRCLQISFTIRRSV